MTDPIRLSPDDRLPLLDLTVGDLPERVLTVGDPARAEWAAQRLTGATLVGKNREYVTYVGDFNGVRLAVTSHGVGAAGAAVCFEELCRGGATRIVRAGTTGGLQPDVVDGDLVVATAAVRDDGLTDGLVPAGYPAVADHTLVNDLAAAAAAVDRPVHHGIVLTSAVFYPHGVLEVDHRLWQRAGVVAVEMEVSALFVIAALHHVRAGAILAVDGNPLRAGDEDMSGYDPGRDVVVEAVDQMLDVALHALTADAR